MQPGNQLYGLVLSGGESTRMGQDKSRLQYHGQEQRVHLYQLLQQYCDDVFLSLRPGQEEGVGNSCNFLLDTHSLRGPFNGILSALQQFPDTAFLVVACDLPLVTANTLEKLRKERDPEKIATAYAATGSDLPEPLLAIWEPRAYAPALAFTKETGKTCPRKFLLQSEIKLICPQTDEELFNANSPEDYRFITHKLTHGEPL